MYMHDVPLAESSNRMDVAFAADHVVKTSRAAVDLADAEAACLAVSAYHEELESQPIAIAKLRNAQPIEGPDGFHLQIVQDRVMGPSLLRLTHEQRVTAVSAAAGFVCAMSTTAGSEDRLGIPIDGIAKNWHVDEAGQPVLVDTYPALLRLDDGRVPAFFSLAEHWFWERRLGTKSGVLTSLFYSSLAISTTVSPLRRLRHMASSSEDWCQEAIPKDAAPVVRRRVERQVALRFMPYAAASVVKAAGTRLLRA